MAAQTPAVEEQWSAPNAAAAAAVATSVKRAEAPPPPPPPPPPQPPERSVRTRTFGKLSSGAGGQQPSPGGHFPTGAPDSSMSVYERVRNFVQINFALNKRTLIISILSYFADIMLFIALNLYLFSNQKYIYEPAEPPTVLASFANNRTTPTSVLERKLVNASSVEAAAAGRSRRVVEDLEPLGNGSTLAMSQQAAADGVYHKQLLPASPRIKQSYMTLQIISLFAFFICFILSYLIKLQFKYHRIALNLFDYDVDTYNNADRDGDGIDSISSTTPSHFSSANNKRFSGLLKRLLHKLMTKFATILLYFLFGYQFCQNCFIQQTDEDIKDGYTIFVHIFILVCVTGRILVVFLAKKYSMNQIAYMKELQQKQKELVAANVNMSNKKSREYYYFYYYTYLLKSNQLAFNQLKQHENSQHTFRIFKLNDTALFVGFMAALFHLFSFIRAFELVFDFLPLLFILILLRLKSYLNASINLVIIFVSLLIISSFSSFNSITNISDYVLKTAAQTVVAASASSSSNETTLAATTTTPVSLLLNGSRLVQVQRTAHSSIINLFSYNLLTFFCFLVTFYLNSLLSIYFCSLSCLERWNLSFLCKISFWRKLSIFLSFLVYLVFVLTCTIAICIRFKSWSFLILPPFFLLSFVWCLFQLLNTINLSHLMNKISDCYLLLNESAGLTGLNSAENSSSHSKKSRSSHMLGGGQTGAGSNLHASLNDLGGAGGNRNSALSQSSSTHNAGGQAGSPLANFKLMKFLTRFLSYDKLNMKPGGSSGQLHTANVPIHRILAFKGIRHLGSISYRISLFCFILTLALAPFAFTTESPFTIGVYLICLCLNFIWLSLLYQFSKTTTGSCIAYALVSPPHFATLGGTGVGGGSTMFRTAPGTLASKKSRTGSSSAYTSSTGTSGTTSSSRTALTATSAGSGSVYLPFSIQQALSRRCTYILSKIHVFLQFHFIENYGCDFAGSTLGREVLESKLRAFFGKRTPDGAAFNTYVLYYCGPTSAKTGDWSLADGTELGIEQIIACWKEINCPSRSKSATAAAPATAGSGESTEEAEDAPIQQASSGSVDLGAAVADGSKHFVGPAAQAAKAKAAKPKKNNSRLILIIDSENTTKSLQYVSSKLNESNIYVALQTVKYNYNNSRSGGAGAGGEAASGESETETKVKAESSSGGKRPAPVIQSISSQTGINDSLVESYLNIGKFTLDWIKSNCNSYNFDFYDAAGAAGNLEELLGQRDLLQDELDEEREYIYENGGRGGRHHHHHHHRGRHQRIKELGAGDSDDEDDEDSDEYDDDEDSTADEYHHVNTKQAVVAERARRYQTPAGEQQRQLTSRGHKAARASTFYEAKCAFSRYWTDFAFDANEKTAAQDVSQFWRIYYPYFICQPLLKLVNCRLFYIRFSFLKRILYFLRRVKIRFIPLREFDTGHGFKLFSS